MRRPPYKARQKIVTVHVWFRLDVPTELFGIDVIGPKSNARWGQLVKMMSALCPPTPGADKHT